MRWQWKPTNLRTINSNKLKRLRAHTKIFHKQKYFISKKSHKVEIPGGGEVHCHLNLSHGQALTTRESLTIFFMETKGKPSPNYQKTTFLNCAFNC